MIATSQVTKETSDDVNIIEECIWDSLFNMHKGPSKNYVTARGGEGVDDFVTYRYVNFEGEGGYFMKLLRNGK